MRYLWAWYLELDARRQSNGFGWLRISWADIDAWARLYRLKLEPFEIRCITEIEHAFFRVHTPPQSGSQQKPKGGKRKK